MAGHSLELLDHFALWGVGKASTKEKVVSQCKTRLHRQLVSNGPFSMKGMVGAVMDLGRGLGGYSPPS